MPSKSKISRKIKNKSKNKNIRIKNKNIKNRNIKNRNKNKFNKAKRIKGGAEPKKTKKKTSMERLDSFNNSLLNVVKGMTLSSIFPNNPMLSNSKKQEKLDEYQQELRTKEIKQKIKKEDEIIAKQAPSKLDDIQEDLDELIEDGEREKQQGSQGLFKSLGNRLGASFGKSIKSLTQPTLSGKLKEVETETEKVKELATKRQCDAQFITNLETLLNTCSEKEAVMVFNECLRILKTKKRLFTQRLGSDIEKIDLLNYDDRSEEGKQVKIPGVTLKKTSTDTINQLETSIEQKMGIKRGTKKAKKKILQGIKE